MGCPSPGPAGLNIAISKSSAAVTATKNFRGAEVGYSQPEVKRRRKVGASYCLVFDADLDC